MDHRQCERCLLSDRCLYPYLFETPVPPDIPQLRGQKQAPHPFILTPPMLSNPCPPPEEPSRRSTPAETPRSQVTTHSLSDGRSVRMVRSPVTTAVEGPCRLATG